MTVREIVKWPRSGRRPAGRLASTGSRDVAWRSGPRAPARDGAPAHPDPDDQK
jgi:hypothetical protein